LNTPVAAWGKTRIADPSVLSDKTVRSKAAFLIWRASSRELHFAWTASLEIKLTLFGALALPQNHEVMRPWQNSQQCCEFWGIGVSLVELVHPPRLEAEKPFRSGARVSSQSDSSFTIPLPQLASATFRDRCAPTAQ
jgi:hypothetical protein